jgi:hypothetical protein
MKTPRLLRNIEPSLHRFVCFALLTLLCLHGCDDGDGGDGQGPGPGPGPGERGSGTLTIGDQTWEFEVLNCLEGAETGNEDVTFASTGVGEGDMHVSVTRQLGFSATGTERDPDAEPIDTINLYIGNPADPEVNWQAAGGPFLEIGANTVRATTDFYDNTGSSDSAPGEFEITCPPL